MKRLLAYLVIFLLVFITACSQDKAPEPEFETSTVGMSCTKEDVRSSTYVPQLLQSYLRSGNAPRDMQRFAGDWNDFYFTSTGLKDNIFNTYPSGSKTIVHGYGNYTFKSKQDGRAISFRYKISCSVQESKYGTFESPPTVSRIWNYQAIKIYKSGGYARAEVYDANTRSLTVVSGQQRNESTQNLLRYANASAPVKRSGSSLYASSANRGKLVFNLAAELKKRGNLTASAVLPAFSPDLPPGPPVTPCEAKCSTLKELYDEAVDEYNQQAGEAQDAQDDLDDAKDRFGDSLNNAAVATGVTLGICLGAGPVSIPCAVSSVVTGGLAGKALRDGREVTAQEKVRAREAGDKAEAQEDKQRAKRKLDDCRRQYCNACLPDPNVLA